MIRTIAIDGPAASGKTVVGRQVAEQLGYWLLDTGIMYRAVTWLALEKGVSPEDASGLGSLAESVRVQPVSMDGESVEVAGRSVGPELRESRVDRNVSNVSRHSVVRRAMVEQQRAYANSVVGRENGASSSRAGIVMIGRDIGTVVLAWVRFQGISDRLGQGARPPPLPRNASARAVRRRRGRPEGNRGPGRHRFPLATTRHSVPPTMPGSLTPATSQSAKSSTPSCTRPACNEVR